MWLRVSRLCAAVLLASAGEQARRAQCAGAGTVLVAAAACAAAQATQRRACLSATCTPAWSALTVVEAGCINAAFVLMSSRFLAPADARGSAARQAWRATAASLGVVCVSTLLWGAWAVESAHSTPLALQASTASTFMLACAGVCATLFAFVVVTGQLCTGALLVLPRGWSAPRVCVVYVALMTAVAAPRLCAGAGVGAHAYAAAIVASRAAVAAALAAAYGMRSPLDALPPPTVVVVRSDGSDGGDRRHAESEKEVEWMR